MFQIVSGYEATMQLAREKPEWLPYVRACHEFATEFGNRFSGSWIGERVAHARSLAPLVRWGVLEKDGPSTRGGHRAYYRVPDLDGVGRALREFG